MPLTPVIPDDVPHSPTYSPGIVATGTRMVYVAGQVAEDGGGNLVGPGDMAAQARQVFANIGRILAEAGARPDDVTKLGIFVAGLRPEHLDMIDEARLALFGTHRPTDTLVGVAALPKPEYLLEVDAVAVVDDK